MEITHNEAIRREFEKQAPSFSHVRFTAELGWLVEQLDPQAHEVVLDVATGTGHVGRAIAAKARYVVAMDLTPAMLRQGKADADTAGIHNILFELGDAARLPYLDASFDLVTSRFSVHHFEQPRVQLAEMVRVCRPGGRVGIADMVAATPDPAITREHNRLERLRDQTHVEVLSLDAFVNLLEQLGLQHIKYSMQDAEVSLDSWLAGSQTPEKPAAEIRAALQAELAGGTPTGMRPFQRDGALWFTHLRAVVVGTKPVP